MKPSRFIILLIAAVMLLGTVGAVSAAPTLVVEVPTEEVAVGETITVPVVMKDSLPFMTFNIDIANDVDGADITVAKARPLRDVDPDCNYVINSKATNSVQGVVFTVDVQNTPEITSTNPHLFSLDIKVTADNILTVPVELTIIEYYNNAGVNQASQVVVQDAVVKVVRSSPIATSIEIDEPKAGTEIAYGAKGTAVAVVKDQYGETMQNAQVTWKATDGIKIDASGNYEVVNAAAGSATITATVGDISDEVSVTLTKGTLTADDFVKIEESYEWGSPIAVTIKAKDGITGYGDITVYYDGKTDVPTDVGTYAVTISVSAGDNYAGVDGLEVGTVTISPKSLADAVIEATAVTYNGEAQTPAFTVTLGEDILTEGTDYTLDAETGIAAGNYAVTVTGKGNYEGTASGEWTIAKATPTADMISCDIPDDLVYTGEPQTLTASAEDGIYGLGAIILKYNGAEAAVDAGTYAVTANITEGANYTAATDLTVGILTIGKATLDKDDFSRSATSAEYNGEAQAVTVTPKVVGVTVTEIQYNGDDTAPSEKGEYVLTITATGGNNYNDVADLEVGTFVITGRQIEQPTITGTYTYTGEVLTADIEESADYKITGNKATTAGTHIVTVSLNDTANTAWKNGGIADLKLEWYIAPKSIAGAGVTPSPETDAFTYDGIVKNPTFTVTDGALTIAENDYIIEGDISSAVAGKHQVTIVGQNNYTGEVKAEWQIAPAVPTAANLTHDDIPYVVYGQTYEVTADAAEGVVGLGEITLLYNGTATAPVNAGTYLVNASIAAGTNYTAAEIYLGNLVIAKATPVAANITCVMDDVVYDGKAHALTAKAADGIVGLGVITLEYNGTVAAPVAAGTYKVNASIAAGENYVAATVELGTFNITKATLTAADFTFTPALPVSYEEETAEAVVVTVKEGIFGNGTVTVKYRNSTTVSTTVPTTEGIYKVNATFGAGTNYTAAEFYLGDMTIVKKVAPAFGDVVTENANGSITVTSGTLDDVENTTTIVSNGVNLVIAFADMTVSGTAATGNITGITATYPNTDAASPKDGEFAYNLTINLGNKLTTLLPEMSGVYNDTVVSKVSTFLGTKATFDGLVMITGKNVDAVNANLTAGNGNIQIVFKIPKAAVSDKSKLVVYHVGNAVKKATVKSIAEDGTFFLVTVTGNGFSSYVAGIETAAPVQDNPTYIPIGKPSKTPSSGDVPTETPSDEPSDEPTDVPGDVPSDIPGTTPSEPGKSPAPILGVLAALGAAVVLRRK